MIKRNVEGKIAGYIDINKEIYFPEDAENIIWFKKLRESSLP